MKSLLHSAFWICILLWSQKGVAQDGSSIRPSSIFSNHMIIQRGEQFKVWGQGQPGDRVQISFQGQTKMQEVPSSGRWLILLKKPQLGGPYKMTINQQQYSDIYVGDIWMAGGQSNMEWPVKSADGFEEELQEDQYPQVHYFRTPKQMSNQEVDTLTGGIWKKIDRQTLADMSAVSYYFAKEIYHQTNIPIGIIDHSWSGSDIEGWLPYEAFENFPEWQEKAKAYQSQEFDQEAFDLALKQWYEGLETEDQGRIEDWPSKQDQWSTWSSIQVPGYWEDSIFPDWDGVVWYSRDIEMKTLPTQSCKLHLGEIDDDEETYFNGQLIGATTGYNISRTYDIEPNQFQENNVLTVRILDHGWGGGFASDSMDIYLECSDEKQIISGNWRIKKGADAYPAQPQGQSLNNVPANRYNSMMVPLFQQAMTGMIWYQGESNCGRPESYSEHFHDMIRIYREQWGKSFPFLFVQLANFMDESEPGPSLWAELRAAQASVLDMSSTAMATAIDIGEADDIHPGDKKTVGLRLANAALAIQYDKNIRYKNPQLASARLENDEIIVEFKHIADGLKAQKPDNIPAFHVKLEDGQYKKVKASLRDNQVFVQIKGMNVVELYYAWSDNPGTLDLYNSEGLPVVPFKYSIPVD